MSSYPDSINEYVYTRLKNTCKSFNICSHADIRVGRRLPLLTGYQIQYIGQAPGLSEGILLLEYPGASQKRSFIVVTVDPLSNTVKRIIKIAKIKKHHKDMVAEILTELSRKEYSKLRILHHHLLESPEWLMDKLAFYNQMHMSSGGADLGDQKHYGTSTFLPLEYVADQLQIPVDRKEHWVERGLSLNLAIGSRCLKANIKR